MNAYEGGMTISERLAQLHEASRLLLRLANEGMIDTADESLVKALSTGASREDAVRRLSTALEELRMAPSLVEKFEESTGVFLKPTSEAARLSGTHERQLLFEILKRSSVESMTISELELAVCVDEILRLSFRKVVGVLKQAGFIEKGHPKRAVIIFPPNTAKEVIQSAVHGLQEIGEAVLGASNRALVTFSTDAKTDPIKLTWTALQRSGLPVSPADRRTKAAAPDEVSIDEVAAFTMRPSPVELAAVQRIFGTLFGPAGVSGGAHQAEVPMPEHVKLEDIRWAITEKEQGMSRLFRARYEDASRYRLTALGRNVSMLLVEGVEVRTAMRLRLDMRARRRRPIPHPYTEFVAGVRSQLYALGFKEMRGPIVESEFWNCDALFMPQNHSARDIHDTIRPYRPSVSHPIPQTILERVAATHEWGGDTGSLGWGYRFSVEQTHRLILRSQGTAISARTLASGVKPPAKYFAIARVFRRDQVDATHHYEFNQLEGIVVDENANLGMLLGLLSMFGREFARAENVKFTPGYFPFTEPSVEVAVKVAGTWVEMGGAGLFRPELTRPLGVTAPVIAWGLGLDRMAMSALKMSDLRPLFEMSVDGLANPTEARRQLVVRQFALSQG